MRTAWTAILRSEITVYVTAVLLTAVLCAAALELWRGDLSVPFTYYGDAIAVGAHFKTVAETGWYEYQPLLGAPFGQSYNDFPTADNLNFMAAGLLGLIFPQWAVAMNVYFLIGFPLAAAAAVWLFREFGLSRPIAVALSVAFALAPYHFIRSEGHLFLASYFVIPLSLVVVLRVISGIPIWGTRQSATRWWGLLSGRGAGTLAILVLTGTAQSYYAVFFLVLLAFAGVVALIRERDWRRFWGAATAGVVTALTMLLNMLPDIVYTALNGANPGGFERGHAEAEIYALKLAQLLLPWSGHRIELLRSIRSEYDTHYPLPSELPALGLIAAVGFIALFLAIAYAASAGAARRAGAATPQSTLLLRVGALVFVAFLFSTTGGLSTFISFVTASLRGWNRMSIYIAALCLLAAGILIEMAIRALRSRLRRGWLRSGVAGGVALVLVGVAYVDQTPAGAGDSYASTAAAFRLDQQFFATLQDDVGAGATILQLPHQPYPEEVGPTGILSSETLVPYLHTTEIAWSGGGIKGRPRADWPGVLQQQYPPQQVVRLAAVIDISGILLDRAAMPAAEADRLEASLLDELGVPLESSDGRYAYYDLTASRDRLLAAVDAAERAAVADRIVNPVTLDETKDFARETDPVEGTVLSRTLVDGASIQVNNDRDEPVDATVALEFFAADGAVSLDIELPDGTRRTVRADGDGGVLEETIRIPAGLSRIVIHVRSGPMPTDGLVLGQRSVVDVVVADFLDR